MKQYNCFQICNNKKCFLSTKSGIKMISEGSCDIEDRSNDMSFKKKYNIYLKNFAITEINYI